MTHHTDAERAEFEAWFEDNRLALIRSMDQEELHAFNDMQPAYWFAWKSAWQAARRAPAAPVPQGYDSGVQTGNRVTLAFDTQSNATAWFEKFCDDYDAAAGTKTIKLPIPANAAPQPPENQTTFQTEVGAAPQQPDGLMRENPATKPEAAPVQLPEPQAEIEVRSMKTYLDLSIHKWRDTLPDGAYNIYTEQQVRDLLAANGIKVAP